MGITWYTIYIQSRLKNKLRSEWHTHSMPATHTNPIITNRNLWVLYLNYVCVIKWSLPLSPPTLFFGAKLSTVLRLIIILSNKWSTTGIASISNTKKKRKQPRKHNEKLIPPRILPFAFSQWQTNPALAHKIAWNKSNRNVKLIQLDWMCQQKCFSIFVVVFIRNVFASYA